MNKWEYVDWGLISYAEAYEKQKALFEATIERKTAGESVRNTVIFCEHPHVITLGKHGLDANLLFPEEILKEKQVELFRTDRGGDITYHGPGQLVGYPIVSLRKRGLLVLEFLRMLEESLIQTLAHFGIAGGRDSRNRGVWVGENKIAAIGIRVSRGVSMHGFALNVDPNMAHFGGIIPCGLATTGVTSMRHELGHAVAMDEVKQAYVRSFRNVFDVVN